MDFSSFIMNMIKGYRIPCYLGFSSSQILNIFTAGLGNAVDLRTAENILVIRKDNYALPSITSTLPSMSNLEKNMMTDILTGKTSVDQGLANAQKTASLTLRSYDKP